MLNRRLASYCALALALWGCGKAPPAITLKKVGEACMVDADCGSSLNGASESMMCKANVCTRSCTAQGDCPSGFACGLAAMGDTMATCYPAAMNPDTGGFGTDCGAVSADPKGGAGCSNAASPCAAGFACHARLKCDPEAYCTKSCAADTDCPPKFFCATLKDSSRLCLKREYCSDCATDDQCPNGWFCATDSTGGRFCAKPCAGDNDCPGPQNGNGYFQKCLADKGGKGKACQPAPIPKGSGAPNLCHGTSAIKGIATTGGVCAGCRPGVAGDCATGEFCFVDEFTLEHLCTEPCTASGKKDSCPAGATCTLTAPGSGYCSADPLGSSITCYP